MSLNTPEPAPTIGETVVYELVIADLKQHFLRRPRGLSWSDFEMLKNDLLERVQMGHKKYGTYLMTFNGRKPLIDAYQEIQDFLMYLRQAIEEGSNLWFMYDVAMGMFVELGLKIQRENVDADQIFA